MSNVKTIDLTGGETEVVFGHRFKCFWVKNLGSEIVYASTDAGAQPEAKNVMTIDAGTSARVSAADLSQKDRLYITGSGKVQVMGSYSDDCPFKRPKKGGDKYEDIIYAEIPLNGSFDGYGYTITSGKENAVFGADCLSYPAKGTKIQMTLSDERIKSAERVVIEFDCRINAAASSSSYYAEVIRIFMCNKNGIAETDYAFGDSMPGRSWDHQIMIVSPSGVNYTSSRINVPGGWRHITLDYTVDDCTLRLTAPPNYTAGAEYDTVSYTYPSFSGYTVGDRLSLGYDASGSRHNYDIRNIKIYTPKTEE